MIYITEHEGKLQPTVSVTDLKTGQSLDVKDLSVEELLCSSIKAPEQMNEMRRLALIYLWKLYPLKMKRLSEWEAEDEQDPFFSSEWASTFDIRGTL